MITAKPTTKNSSRKPAIATICRCTWVVSSQKQVRSIFAWFLWPPFHLIRVRAFCWLKSDQVFLVSVMPTNIPRCFDCCAEDSAKNNKEKNIWWPSRDSKPCTRVPAQSFSLDLSMYIFWLKVTRCICFWLFPINIPHCFDCCAQKIRRKITDKKYMMTTVGFEPTSTNTWRPERHPIDRSGRWSTNDAPKFGYLMFDRSRVCTVNYTR